MVWELEDHGRARKQSDYHICNSIHNLGQKNWSMKQLIEILGHLRNLVVLTNFIKSCKISKRIGKIMKIYIYFKLNNCGEKSQCWYYLQMNILPFDSFTLITIQQTMMKMFSLSLKAIKDQEWLCQKERNTWLVLLQFLKFVGRFWEVFYFYYFIFCETFFSCVESFCQSIFFVKGSHH